MALAPAGGTGVGPFPGVAADRAPPSGGTGSPLTPSELLVALHNMEDTVGLKRAVEGPFQDNRNVARRILPNSYSNPFFRVSYVDMFYVSDSF